MVTVKKDTIKTKTFEREIIKAIKLAKQLTMPEETRKELLDSLRGLHNGCLEWAEPTEDFRVPKGM